MIRDCGADFQDLTAVFCQTPVAVQNESWTGDASAPALLINTENLNRTIHPKKIKNIYIHIYMISLST